jgi:hypothetical protein
VVIVTLNPAGAGRAGRDMFGGCSRSPLSFPVVTARFPAAARRGADTSGSARRSLAPNGCLKERP